MIRWLWKTRNELPRRRSTLAGWTIAGSHGSMRMRPSSTRRRIVPSESTEVAVMRPSLAGRRDARTRNAAVYARSMRRARATTVRVRGGGSGSGSPCGPRRGWRGSGVRGWRGRGCAAAAVVGARRLALLGRRADRPPHDQQQRDDRDLQDEHQVDERPAHATAMLPLAAGTGSAECPVPTEGGGEETWRGRPWPTPRPGDRTRAAGLERAFDPGARALSRAARPAPR